MNLYLIANLYLPLEQFARSGGGGSGGGSGSGEGILVVLGYLPMHFAGAFLRKAYTKNQALTIPLNIVGWVGAVFYAIAWSFIWQGIGVFIGVAGLVGMGAGLYGWFGKLKQTKFVKSALNKAASKDTAWNEEKLTAHANQIFMKYQQDWSTFNTESIKSYTTVSYANHSQLLLAVLRAMKRRNTMEDVVVTESMITNVSDVEDNTQDTFTVGFTASAKDSLIDETTNQTLFTDKGSFTEYWTFKRSENSWLLGGIMQETANKLAYNAEIAALANQYGYYYSADMGWLFIPKRGQLFGGAKFGTSDINNHVVGLYNNQLLMQIYSYVKDPQNQTKSYVVAQANVPRQYGNIIVRRNKLIQKPILGMERVRTEWIEFNKKYEVFATAPEQATSFELLNPTYMEQLESLPFEVNIEVVDNVVYLYTNERSVSVEAYETMLDLLNKAFKEMRL